MSETFHTAPLLAASCPHLGGSEAMAWHRYHFADVADVQSMIVPRSAAWDTYAWGTDPSHVEFCGTRDMAEAVALARDGWRAGADAAAKAWAGLQAVMPQARRQIAHGFSGSSVSVARMLAGQPRHMRRRVLADAPVRPIITLIANASAPSSVKAEDMLQHAIAQAAVVDMLETRGYRCAVIYLKRAVNPGDTFGFEMAVRVKAADMPRNLAMLTFVLGHPGMYRRIGFALASSRQECRPLTDLLGMPRPVDQKLAKPGTFIMPAQQVCDAGTMAVERFQAVLRALGRAGCPGIPEDYRSAA